MEEDISKWMRPLNYRDLAIMSLLCITTLGIALYDFYNQMETKQVCLNDCNNHWVKEFENKCMGIYGQKNMSQGLVYNVPTPPDVEQSQKETRATKELLTEGLLVDIEEYNKNPEKYNIPPNRNI